MCVSAHVCVCVRAPTTRGILVLKYDNLGAKLLKCWAFLAGPGITSIKYPRISRDIVRYRLFSQKCLHSVGGEKLLKLALPGGGAKLLKCGQPLKSSIPAP